MDLNYSIKYKVPLVKNATIKDIDIADFVEDICSKLYLRLSISVLTDFLFYYTQYLKTNDEYYFEKVKSTTMFWFVEDKLRDIIGEHANLDPVNFQVIDLNVNYKYIARKIYEYITNHKIN